MIYYLIMSIDSEHNHDLMLVDHRDHPEFQCLYKTREEAEEIMKKYDRELYEVGSDFCVVELNVNDCLQK